MKKLLQKRNQLVAELTECKEMMRGSLNSVCVSCKRANCICDSKSGGVAFRLTYKDRNQKTGIVYVPNDRVAEVKAMIKTYARFRELTEQIIETNISVFRNRPKI
jgi:RNase P/RNase MRP subunit POP5